VQNEKTVLMFAVTKDVRVETMQLLLDSGAATSINAKGGDFFDDARGRKRTVRRLSH
jgi:hypothetical protein